MISRVADHCFWFGRYVERAEATARLLAATQSLALDAELEPQACWRPVVVVSGEEEQFVEKHGAEWGDGERVQDFMAWDADSSVSILRSIRGARWNARAIREVVSLEAWETINELHLYLGHDDAKTEFRDHKEAFYKRVRSSTQLALGLLRSTMLHDDALDFIWLGVLLERTSQTARILDVHHHAFTAPKRHEVVETALWLSLLRSLSGFEPFMKQNQGKVTSDAVARFLIGEERFPRSIAYCVGSSHDRLRRIRPPEERSLPGGLTLERLRVLDDFVTSRRRGPESGETVHELLTHVVDETSSICDSLGKELLGYG
ncbi:MAG TPA: alpha-E domain-containing protein [Kofleriaceae bacterium]|jgi:uncharacterized alpha-E superfamily protein|nr:alpha-E domain-containing protein [Kofleriaceae bacterium]